MARDDIERAATDRSGRAEYGDLAQRHRHNPRPSFAT
jgi:hypothetical protein